MTQHFHGEVAQVAGGNIYNLPPDHLYAVNTEVLQARLEVALAEHAVVADRRVMCWQLLAMIAGFASTVALGVLLLRVLFTGTMPWLMVLILAPAGVGHYLFLRHLRANSAELEAIARRIRAMQAELDRRVR